LESEAILSILYHIHEGQVSLASSAVLKYEAAQVPIAARREHSMAILANADVIIDLVEPVRMRASAFVASGLDPIDALHLAAAEFAGVDYFCTCDDRLLRSAGRIPDLAVTAISPIELISRIEP
jgi:predicted nucleic acid-binding protein